MVVLAAEEGFTIVSFWTLASQRAQATYKHHLREICIHRQSAVATSAPARPPDASTAVARPVRRLLATGEVREPPLLMSLAATDPHVKEQAAKVAKVQSLFEFVGAGLPRPSRIGGVQGPASGRYEDATIEGVHHAGR